jgi:exosortase
MKAIWQSAIMALLIVAIYWTTIRIVLVGRWINDGNWSHGWLIPLFSAYFLYLRRDELKRVSARPTMLGALVLAVSLGAFFWFAWVQPFAYLQALTILGTIFGSVLLLAGWPIVRIVWFPIFFLFLAIPLPQQQYFELTFPLRAWASTASAALLPLLIPGLHTEAQAVVIDYVSLNGTSGQLNVEEACSGMRLMMAFVTLGLAMAYLGERPLWQRLIMVASCIPIAVFCNTIRVTLTGYLTITGREDLAQGTPHQLLGIAMLLLALGLFAAIGYALDHLFVEVEEA